MNELKTKLQKAVDDLEIAERAFNQAVAAADQARVMVSATETLRARAEVETASEQILERASQAESALDEYRAASESEYRNAMQAATTRSRKLHITRQELEQTLSDLAIQIEVVNAEEKPAIDAAVEAQGWANQTMQYASEVTTRAVRLIHETKAAA
jgi:hypothetical protein